MNVLITSAGRRVKVIQYFRQTLNEIGGKVIATDCDKNAPAIYFADENEITPRINDEGYLSSIITVCKKYNVDAVVSLIDPELEILAKNKKQFDMIGVKLILSPLNMIQYSFDKQETYNYLSKLGIPCVPTFSKISDIDLYLDKKEYSFPLVVKPRKGSASIGIEKVNNKEELNILIEKNNDIQLIIQPYYKKREFGIDVYIDMITGELVDLFIKEKIRMRSGETDKSIAIHNNKIESLVKEFVMKTNFRGPIDIDCFEYKGKYYISEVNPRFGGGYPHAYEAGCNFVTYILNNLKGQENKSYTTFTYKSNSIMRKYDNLLVLD